MSAYSCAQLRDLAPEFALGVLGGAQRAEAIMHVNGCARCQAPVNELSEVSDTRGRGRGRGDREHHGGPSGGHGQCSRRSQRKSGLLRNRARG